MEFTTLLRLNHLAARQWETEVLGVCEHTSYRQFLRAVFLHTKKEKSHLTTAQFAKWIGLSPSSFKMIVTGRRNLTVQKVHEIAKRLKLSTLEREYFETLVLKENSKSSAQENYYQKKAKKIKSQHKIEKVMVSNKKLLSDHLIIPVLVYLTEHGELRSAELSKKFKVDLPRAEKILSTLRDSGAVIKKRNSTHYEFAKVVHTIDQQNYLKVWLEETIKRLPTFYHKEDTLFSATTASLTSEQFQEFKTEIKDVIEKYLSLESTPASQLYQLGLQGFPLTEPSSN